MDSSQLVVLYFDEDILVNDKTNPPTAMIFKMEERLPHSGEFMFRAVNVQGQPYLGYKDTFDLVSSPVIASKNFDYLYPIQSKSQVTIKTEFQSLGQWYLCIDPFLNQSPTIDRHANVKSEKSSTNYSFWVFALIIFLLMIWLFSLTVNS